MVKSETKYFGKLPRKKTISEKQYEEFCRCTFQQTTKGDGDYFFNNNNNCYKISGNYLKIMLQMNFLELLILKYQINL